MATVKLDPSRLDKKAISVAEKFSKKHPGKCIDFSVGNFNNLAAEVIRLCRMVYEIPPQEKGWRDVASNYHQPLFGAATGQVNNNMNNSNPSPTEKPLPDVAKLLQLQQQFKPR